MKKIIIAVVVLVVAVGAWMFIKNGSMGQQVSKGDTIDTVNEFYASWLKAVSPADKATLAGTPYLSSSLQSKLTSALADTASTLDPVLCQAKAPSAISVKTLSEKDGKAEIIVSPRGGSSSEVAIVSLNQIKTGWYINDINCSGGDVAPAQGEFTFDTEGFLLKKSVPKPFNNKNWHLVFEQNGEKGHIVPLIFSKDSQCTSLSGTTATCKPEQFTEATKALVQGDLTELGVAVKKLTLKK